MTSIREFISARRRDLSDQLAVLDLRRAAIETELRELLAAELALPNAEKVTNSGSSEARVISQSAPLLRYVGLRPGSIKAKIVDVLGDWPLGAEANEILDLIQRKHGEEIPRASLSPQLSRLKRDGFVRLDGRVWSLVQTSETPGEESPSAQYASGAPTPLNESRGDDDVFG